MMLHYPASFFGTTWNVVVLLLSKKIFGGNYIETQRNFCGRGF
jgi:hypothetical protein